MTRIARFTVILVTLIVGIALQAPEAASQSASNERVVIAITNQLPAFAPGQPAPASYVRALVMRSGGASRSDVIVLKEDATPADLHRAVAALNMSRARKRTLAPGRAATIMVPEMKQNLPVPPGTQQKLVETLAAVRAQSARSLPGVGQARWIELASVGFD